MKNILKIVMVIVGTLVGAGFASGREIYLFFAKFGKLGIVGILISGILTGTIIYFTLKTTKNENENKKNNNKENINGYSEFLEKINKNKIINFFIKNIVIIFLLISFYIMVAAFSAYIKQIYEIPIYISSITFVFCTYIIFRKNIKGIVKINEILVPFLIIFILYLGLKNIPYVLTNKNIFDTNIFESNINGFLINSFLYTSYNSIILIPILISMKKYIKNEKEIRYITIITGFIIILMSLSIYGLLLKGIFYIPEVEMPLLEIVIEFGKIYLYIYNFVIIVSIFTSAISTGYGFLENVSKNKKTYNNALIFMCISSIFISNIGFSKLVKILYPIFGILGIIQIYYILKNIKNL